MIIGYIIFVAIVCLIGSAIVGTADAIGTNRWERSLKRNSERISAERERQRLARQERQQARGLAPLPGSASTVPGAAIVKLLS